MSESTLTFNDGYQGTGFALVVIQGQLHDVDQALQILEDF
jgi:hypothetical protein